MCLDWKEREAQEEFSGRSSHCNKQDRQRGLHMKEELDYDTQPEESKSFSFHLLPSNDWCQELMMTTIKVKALGYSTLIFIAEQSQTGR